MSDAINPITLIFHAGDTVDVPAVSSPEGEDCIGHILRDVYPNDGHALVAVSRGGVTEIPVGMLTEPDKEFQREVPPMRPHTDAAE